MFWDQFAIGIKGTICSQVQIENTWPMWWLFGMDALGFPPSAKLSEEIEFDQEHSSQLAFDRVLSFSGGQYYVSPFLTLLPQRRDDSPGCAWRGRHDR